MQVRNQTRHLIEPLLEASVSGHDHRELIVEVKYSPLGSKRSISGTYYRLAPTAPDGRLIRLRINRGNRYPITVPFKLSEYFKKSDRYGREVTYQKMRNAEFDCAEHLLVAIFLHEFSHYLDHVEGRNGRYKQTKADMFALDGLRRLSIL
jgi:hypothetical protein